MNNQHISVTQRQSVLDAQKLAGEGKTGEEIREILERTKMDSMIYITVDTLEYLKKGGRLTPCLLYTSFYFGFAVGHRHLILQMGALLYYSITYLRLQYETDEYKDIYL